MEKCKYSLDEIKKQITSTNYYDVLSFFSMKQIDYRVINDYVFERGIDGCAKLFIYTKHGVACFYVMEGMYEKTVDLTQAHLIRGEDIPKLEKLLQKEKEKVEILEFILQKQRVRKTVGREKL